MQVSPACAGMIPVLRNQVIERRGEPRMRGDDPLGIIKVDWDRE